MPNKGWKCLLKSWLKVIGSLLIICGVLYSITRSFIVDDIALAQVKTQVAEASIERKETARQVTGLDKAVGKLVIVSERNAEDIKGIHETIRKQQSVFIEKANENGHLLNYIKDNMAKANNDTR